MTFKDLPALYPCEVTPPQDVNLGVTSAKTGKSSEADMLHTLSIPKPDDESLAAHIYPAVRELFLLVNKRFREIFSDPARPEGPYLMSSNVDLEIYKHFDCMRRERWAKFLRCKSSGDVWYYGDPSFVHEAVICEIVTYLHEQFVSALDDMPLGPPDFEAEVNRARMAYPRLSRGQCVYDVLFLDVGSLGRTISDEWKAKRSRQPVGEENREGGHKEADALVLCERNTNIAVLALEVAYKNESLAETAEEVLMWGKQPDLLAIGLKIDSRSSSHKLDPKAVLFISRKPVPRDDATAIADGLVSVQYPVGRGSGVSVDRYNGPGMRSHVELENDPEHGHLLAEIDWEGSAARTPKQWYSPADGYDLKQGESTVSLPLGQQLESAVIALLCSRSAVNGSAVHGLQLLDSIPLEFSAFMDTFSIAIDFRIIRRIILKATLYKWMENNLPRSSPAGDALLAALQTRKLIYKTERTAEREAEEKSEIGGPAGEAGPSTSKSRNMSREKSGTGAERDDGEHGSKTPETPLALTPRIGSLGRKAAKNAHRKARRVKKAKRKLKPLQSAVSE